MKNISYGLGLVLFTAFQVTSLNVASAASKNKKDKVGTKYPAQTAQAASDFPYLEAFNPNAKFGSNPLPAQAAEQPEKPFEPIEVKPVVLVQDKPVAPVTPAYVPPAAPAYVAPTVQAYVPPSAPAYVPPSAPVVAAPAPMFQRSESQVPVLRPEPTAARNLKNAWAAEINGATLGGIGNSASQNEAGIGSSEALIGIQLRTFLSEELAMGVSLPTVSFLATRSAKNGYQLLYPAMLGFRYQGSSLVGNFRVKPWVEAEAGMTLVSLKNQILEDGSVGAVNSSQVSSRASTGFDYFFSNHQNLYCGFKVSYFMTKGLSNAQTGLSVGYLF
ncbi:MAG: hypothetical protein JNL01_09030 [Bdellovibrionales bacterium]|nr:hypothetical protein [Bdellovibrionales bacterium]